MLFGNSCVSLPVRQHLHDLGMVAAQDARRAVYNTRSLAPWRYNSRALTIVGRRLRTTRTVDDWADVASAAPATGSTAPSTGGVAAHNTTANPNTYHLPPSPGAACWYPSRKIRKRLRIFGGPGDNMWHVMLHGSYFPSLPSHPGLRRPRPGAGRGYWLRPTPNDGYRTRAAGPAAPPYRTASHVPRLAPLHQCTGRGAC